MSEDKEWQRICDSYADENQRLSDRIEKLEANIKLQLEWYLSNKRVLADRIEKLEAALLEIDTACDYSGAEYVCRDIARKALEGKDE